jgi:hypothetical protein
VRLINGDRHKDVISLIDSGADLCLFHSDIGRMVGLKIEAAPKLAFQGVFGAKEAAYVHRVDLVVRGLNAITLDVGFTESMVGGTDVVAQRPSLSSFANFDLSENSWK